MRKRKNEPFVSVPRGQREKCGREERRAAAEAKEGSDAKRSF